MPARRSLTRWKKLFVIAVISLILTAMGISVARHGGPMFRAVATLDPVALAVAVALSLIYRAVNAAGWGLILEAMGERVRAVAAARLWLASEACRWLPGGLWSFGSRAVLASQRGIPARTAAASLVLELGVTVAAWGVVAALGASTLRLSPFPSQFAAPQIVILGLVLLATAGLILVVCSRSQRFRRIRDRIATLSSIRELRPDASRLFAAFAFYVAMASFNGATLWILVKATPGGSASPLLGVIAANGVAWLVGFFALFAPGGLIVREACLAGTLCSWMPGEQALAVALAWRLIQIAAELICFVGVAATSLPESLSPDTATCATVAA